MTDPNQRNKAYQDYANRRYGNSGRGQGGREISENEARVTIRERQARDQAVEEFKKGLEARQAEQRAKEEAVRQAEKIALENIQRARNIALAYEAKKAREAEALNKQAAYQQQNERSRSSQPDLRNNSSSTSGQVLQNETAQLGNPDAKEKISLGRNPLDTGGGDESSLAGYEQRIERLTEYEQNVGKRGQRARDIFRAVPGLRGDNYFQGLARGILALPATIPLGVAETANLYFQKVYAGTEGLIRKESRASTKAAIVQAAEETPAYAAQQNDPRTPEGLINLGLNVVAVKGAGGARANARAGTESVTVQRGGTVAAELPDGAVIDQTATRVKVKAGSKEFDVDVVSQAINKADVDNAILRSEQSTLEVRQLKKPGIIDRIFRRNKEPGVKATYEGVARAEERITVLDDGSAVGRGDTIQSTTVRPGKAVRQQGKTRSKVTPLTEDISITDKATKLTKPTKAKPVEDPAELVYKEQSANKKPFFGSDPIVDYIRSQVDQPKVTTQALEKGVSVRMAEVVEPIKVVKGKVELDVRNPKRAPVFKDKLESNLGQFENDRAAVVIDKRLRTKGKLMGREDYVTAHEKGHYTQAQNELLETPGAEARIKDSPLYTKKGLKEYERLQKLGLVRKDFEASYSLDKLPAERLADVSASANVNPVRTRLAAPNLYKYVKGLEAPQEAVISLETPPVPKTLYDNAAVGIQGSKAVKAFKKAKGLTAEYIDKGVDLVADLGRRAQRNPTTFDQTQAALRREGALTVQRYQKTQIVGRVDTTRVAAPSPSNPVAQAEAAVQAIVNEQNRAAARTATVTTAAASLKAAGGSQKTRQNTTTVQEPKRRQDTVRTPQRAPQRKPASKPLLGQKADSLLKQEQENIGRQRNRQTQQPRQTPKTTPDVIQVPRQLPLQKPKQEQVQELLTEQKQRPALARRTGTPQIQQPTKGIVPIIPPRSARKAEKGFDVQVRVRGQFKKVNAQPLSEEQAVNLGALKVKGSAAASFKVIPTNRPAARTAFPKQNLKNFYKSKREAGVIIQAPRNRISSPGEKREIPYKAKQIAFGRKTRKLFGGV